jgi:succinylglutamate desuccinylase
LTSRELGARRGARSGPTLIVVAGLHGNEAAGVFAAQRVLAELEGAVLHGEVVAFAGNLRALQRGQRFTTRDLNRQWTPALLEAARRGEASDAEGHELAELATAIDGAIARARGPVFLVDVHTTSAAGVPFVLFGDTFRQRDFVSALGLPAIIGLEEQLDGVMSAYWTTRGLITCAVEGGQHDDPTTVDALEAVLWCALARAGLFDVTPPGARLDRARRVLARQVQGLPHFLEVVSRHAIGPEDGFVMEPGFRNIAPVKRGQLLARQASGEVRAPSDGLVLLPLYQAQGHDGFFWGRALRPRALALNAWARTAGLDRLVACLPGVRREPGEPGALSLSTSRPDSRRLALLRQLGYRRVRPSGDGLRAERITVR